MPFGVIYAFLFFCVVSIGLLFVSAGESWGPLQAVRVCLALTSAALAIGLLLRRPWSRWLGIVYGAATSILVLVAMIQRAGVGEYLVLFGAVAALGLLIVPVTGDVRAGAASDRLAAPRLGRALGTVATLGTVGLLGSLWWGSLESAPPASGPTADVMTAGLAERVRWSDFGSGLRRAGDQGKPVLVSFISNWCGYCKKMDRTTWKDPSVIQRLAAIVAVRVDAEDERERNGFRGAELAARYGVAGYPTLLLMDSDGGVVARTNGYLEPRELLRWLDGSLREASRGTPTALRVASP